MGAPDPAPQNQTSPSTPTPAPSAGITPTYPYVETPAYVLQVSESNAQVAAAKLAQDADQIAQQTVRAVPSGAFGPSGLGQELAAQTDLAHQRLHGAVRLMAGAMHGYSTAVVKAKDTLLGTDEASEQDIDAVQQAMATSTDRLGTPIAAAPEGS